MSIISTENCYMITRDEVAATNQIGPTLLNQTSISSRVPDGSKIESIISETENISRMLDEVDAKIKSCSSRLEQHNAIKFSDNIEKLQSCVDVVSARNIEASITNLTE